MQRDSKERIHEILPTIQTKNTKGSPRLVMPKEQHRDNKLTMLQKMNEPFGKKRRVRQDAKANAKMVSLYGPKGQQYVTSKSKLDESGDVNFRK